MNLPKMTFLLIKKKKNNQSSIHNTPLDNLPQNPIHPFPRKTHESEVVQTQTSDFSSSIEE